MRGLLLASVLVFLFFVALGQEYNFRIYGVARGLSSDIVKASTEDSLGYFWIATDEGLVKYDGTEFTSYRNVTHSNYIKGFFRTKAGKLLMYGDLDLIEIKNLGDTVIFKSLCPVSRVANDSTLSYPKLIYEDRNGDLWIAESQAVVKISQESFKRYPFSLSDRSPQFLRSFSFFEDRKGSMFITSFQGNTFKYDSATDQFIAVPQKFPEGVEFVSVRDNKIFVGASNGVYTSDLHHDGGFESPQLSLKIKSVSYLSFLSDGQMLIATRSASQFVANIETGVIKRLQRKIGSVNHIYISNQNDIWLSSNDGWLLMRKNLFNNVNPDANDFIECIAEDVRSGTIYYATSQVLYSFDRQRNENKIIMDVPGGYFQSLLSTKDGLWIANAFKVFLFSDGKVKREFDFTRFGRFITNLSSGSDGKVWLVIPGLSEAFYIDETLALQQINVPLGNDDVINVIKEAGGGIYIGSSGSKKYLFFKANNETRFRDVSVPLDDLRFAGQFNVTDLTYFDGHLWLATSAGVLQYKPGSIRKADLGNRFIRESVKLVHNDGIGNLIIDSSLGLVLFDLKHHTAELFNESSGLPSNTITPRGIFRAHDNSLWIGTSKGLCFSVGPLTKLEPTPGPRFTKVLVNGTKISSGNEIRYGSFLSISLSSFTFPEDEVVFQYRTFPDTAWTLNQKPELGLSVNRSGLYIVEVRAKKNGPYKWSDPSSLRFTVEKPVWQRTWFYLLEIVVVLAIVVSTILITRNYYRRARQRLKRLIDARTQQLIQANTGLIKLNEEKNNLISIVAHDLKSPLHQMMGLHTLIKSTTTVDDEAKKYLTIMEESTKRLDGMIGRILDINAIESQKTMVVFKKVDISEVIARVVARFENEANKKNIEIVESLLPSAYAKSDADLFDQVIENLLSNALKFSPFDRKVFVRTLVNDENVIIEIEDQGPGLSVRDKQKLFSKFQKLSAKPTGGESSTGLGLSIVKKYVAEMHGRIFVQSEPGTGTLFVIWLQRWSDFL